jgi:cytochrome b561
MIFGPTRRRDAPEASIMSLRNSPDRYGAVSLTLHWLTAVLIVAAWLLGTFDDVLPKGPARDAGLFAHITFGLTMLALLAIRLPWRLADPPPRPEPATTGPWAQHAAHFTHWLLYALLAGVITAGIVLQFARGRPLPLFGLAEIASPWVADRAFARSVKEVHEVLANALVSLAVLHAVAALFHHWILRDRTLLRMLPRFRR